MKRYVDKCREIQRNAKNIKYKVQRNEENCREMHRNSEKCKEIQRNAEKFSEMQRHVEKCRELQKVMSCFRNKSSRKKQSNEQGEDDIFL